MKRRLPWLLALLFATILASIYQAQIADAVTYGAGIARILVGGSYEPASINEINFSTGFSKVTSGHRTTLTVGDVTASFPIVDTTALVSGSADATKKVRIEADGITTGTTRVLTMANADVDLGAMQTTVNALPSTFITNGAAGGTPFATIQGVIDFRATAPLTVAYANDAANAQADLTYAIPAATASVDGYMPQAYAQKLDNLWETTGKCTASTTDATVTTCATLATSNGDTSVFIAECAGEKDDGTQVASYTIKGTYRTASGTATQVGGSQTMVAPVEDDTAWNAAWGSSTSNALLTVQGNTGDNVSWECYWRKNTL